MAGRIKAFGRQKTIATADVREVLSFGKEAYLMRLIPFALAIGLLGLVMLFLRDSGGMLASLVLIAAGFGYVVFALWRRSNPAAPMLVLSPDGIRYRVAGTDTVDIPWDEVETVESADIYVRARGLVGSTQCDVPIVMVSEAFYRAHPHHAFTPKDGQVRVAIFHSVLSQSPDELREAIERRWRAFSNHPNARLPPAPGPAPRRRLRLTRGQKWAALDRRGNRCRAAAVVSAVGLHMAGPRPAGRLRPAVCQRSAPRGRRAGPSRGWHDGDGAAR